MQENQERQYCFGAQGIKVYPEQRKGIFLLFLPRTQGLCPEGLWVGTKAGSLPGSTSGKGRPQPERLL